MVSAPLGEDLVTAALMGTARRAPDLATIPGAAGDLARRIDEADPAGALLDAAALVAVTRRAGTPARRAPEAPEPAAPETLASVPPAAAQRLAGLLVAPGATADPALLTWLDAAAAAGYRAPAQHLPALLDLACTPSTGAAVRDAVVAVLGERGRWLAAQRDDWAARIDPAPPAGTGDVWDHGTDAQRAAHLSHVRARDPQAGLDLLAGTWKKEKADTRAALLRRLGTGLSAADAPFLEAAVADRSAGVRALAVELLSLLPDAPFTRAVTARALASVRAERRLVRRTLALTLPEAHPGDPFPPPRTGHAPSVWLLTELVAATPLAAWTAHLGGSPADLVAMTAKDAELDVLRRGWTRAARTQRDPVWAAALLAAGVDALDLVDVLAPDARARHLAGLLARDGSGPANRSSAELAGLLARAGDPWPDLLVAAVLTWAAGAGRRQHDWYANGTLTEAVQHLPPRADVEATLRGAADRLDPAHTWRHALHRAADTLHTRRVILEELR
ncbi:DUF5691 domain-containing protein [Cellulomonas fimi]|uniref:DUF5691 domain-containing protein n=1 Tax=Cellulomonas fimi TaxID=1708 RepID=UPI0002E6593F|nr:DUF5691 domain-containing protein [Cellulomonas fimi]NNH08264.1 hypothetical protein [Cellulomonas fimi]